MAKVLTSPNMPPKRKRVAAPSEPVDEGPPEDALKKHKTAINDAVDELLCPITLALPLDPVNAQDGRVYERTAIEGWFARNRSTNGTCKSPITGDQIGTTLTPALCLKNMIEKMVKSGALSGEKVGAWRKQLDGQVEVEAMRRKAEAGDADAMYRLGRWNTDGRKGLPVDNLNAFRWFAQAAEKGHVKALGYVGYMYLDGGKGVEKCPLLAMHYLSRAAELGNEHSCYVLGWTFSHGCEGIPKNEKLARQWYTKIVSSSLGHKNVSEHRREAAWEWLLAHPA